MLQQIEHHDQKMGRSVQSPINISEDRKQELLRTKAKLDQLKQKISLGGLSISEAKAEGRRY